MIVLSTDAPIYHRPYGTVGLMIACVLASILVPAETEDVGQVPNNGKWAGAVVLVSQDNGWNAEDFRIEGEDPAPGLAADNDADPVAPLPGSGQRTSGRSIRLRLHPGSFNPIQWVCSPLIHSNVFELIFNLIALWAFGLIIEGKVGTRGFLAIFFGIGISQAVFTQACMLFSSGPPLSGAETTVLGLIGVAVIWAPKNCVEVWLTWWIPPFDLSILIYGFIQFAFALLIGFESVLYLTGFGFGLLFGMIWLRREWVDCEGWDIISVMKNEHDRPNRNPEDREAEREAQELVRSSLGNEEQKKEAAQQRAKRKAKDRAKERAEKATKARKKGEIPEEDLVLSPEARLALMHENIEELILDGNSNTAIKMMEKLERNDKKVQLSQPALAKLLRDLSAASEYKRAVPYMIEHVQRFDVQRVPLQLNLAKIYLHLERPKKAINLLRQLNRDEFDDSQQATWSNLLQIAKQQVNEGIIEIRDD